MSRRKLKLLAKSQISGNVIILFIIGVLANIDMWFYRASRGVAVARSGVIGSIIALIVASNVRVTKSEIGAYAVRADVNKIINIIAEQTNHLSITLGICGLIFLVLYYVVGSPLRISLSHTYLSLTKDETPKFVMLGYGFKKCWEQSVLLNLFRGLFISLWSLLFIIPGIIKSYSYSMSNYIMAENPEIGALDAITKSRKMMSGNKFRLFVLDLSFIFWYLLIPITFGIAEIYVDPYIEATKANFYLKLKEQYQEEEIA